MLAEFVKEISKMATARREPRMMKLPGGRVMVLHSDGTETIEAIPTETREDEVEDLDTFLALLKAESNPQVWIVADGGLAMPIRIFGVYNSDDRVEYCKLDLPTSAEWGTYLQLMTPQNQKVFCSAIRDHLFNCVPSNLLGMLRALDFTRRNDGSRTITSGSESLGRSVEAKVQSREGQLPEMLEVRLQHLRTFDGRLSFDFNVPTVLDVDATQEKFAFVPQGDALHEARQRCALFLRSSLEESLQAAEIDAPVYIGTPTLGLESV